MNAFEDIAAKLGDRIMSLAPHLLRNGHRAGPEWRAGSVAGEAGSSLGVHLVGDKAGIWKDFATGQGGDALDLVKATLGKDTAEAMAWARDWLGGNAADIPQQRRSDPPPADFDREDPDRWRYAWRPARPYVGTLGQTYLTGRGLAFDDPQGRVLRFAKRRARKSPADVLEHHPALLALLSDVRTGEACGLVNIYLQADGRDRIRDRKAKTGTGRCSGAAVMLSAIEEPVAGLTVCEGVETGIALH
jgi:hypothetical protein